MQLLFFVIQERRYLGDDMVQDFEKRGKKRKTVDKPGKLFDKHLYRTKAGKFSDGVLKLTSQDVKNIKYRASKRSR